MAYLEQDVTLFEEEDSVIQLHLDEELTGYTGANFKWGLLKADGVLLIKTGSDITITDALEGIIEIAINDADTTGMAAGCYTYQLQVTDPITEKVNIRMIGVVTIKENIFLEQ